MNGFKSQGDEGIEQFPDLAITEPVLHTSLDKAHPIQFFGTYITYNGQKIDLDANTLYVDGSMPDSIANAYNYVFNNLNNAVTGINFNGVEGADFGSKAIVPYLNSEKVSKLGTEAAPVVVYIAPYVYWGDNWADPAIRRPTDPEGLYGITIKCNWLKFIGLTDNRDKVIICGDRGQTNGSNGNWTLFNITGDGLRTEHITVANYCNIDLDYPLKPALNHTKRTETICQAQLMKYSGDKALAIDTSFRSRHNLMPFSGTRTLYYNCHFECYHDSLSGSAVYLDCDFEFYDDCPIYRLSGAVFLNSEFISLITTEKQGMANVPGSGAMIDCRFIRDSQLGPIKVLWSIYADSELPALRGYQSNVTLNGVPITISEDSNGMTVDITNLPDALAAYKFTYKGRTYYNTYNLLHGNDNWDPMGVSEIVTAASAEAGKDLGNISAGLSVSLQSGSSATIISGETTSLSTHFTSYFQTQAGSVTWQVQNPADADYAILPEDKTGSSIKITGNNTDELPKIVTITARTDSGLEGAYQITIKPTPLAPPVFTADPVMIGPADGKMTVTYALDLGTRADMSLITWYRCTDAQGSNAIATAVTRMNTPEVTYTLTEGDAGYFIKATVEPRHIRSVPGPAKSVVSSIAINKTDVNKRFIETNFQNFPVDVQPRPLSGYWMVNAYNPPDTYDASAYPTRYFQKYTPTTGKAFDYTAVDRDDAVGCGLTGISQGGRILYTTTGKSYGDMKVSLICDTEKTTGEGFGSANSCYVDLFIKYDTSTLNGYSVRVERTPAQWNGCEVSLMKHTDGYSSYLPLEVYGSVQTEGKTSVRTSGFMAPCTLTVWSEGDKLYGTIRSGKPENPGQVASGLIHDVDLRAEIVPNTFGGAGYINTGTVSPGNRTILHNLRIDWVSDDTESIL